MAIKGLRSFGNDVFYCLKLSFHISKFNTLMRMGIQVLRAVIPLALVYATKTILDILASADAAAYSSFLLVILVYLALQILLQWTNRLGNYFQQVQDEMLSNYVDQRTIGKASRIDMRFFDSPTYYDKIQWLKTNASSINQTIWSIAESIGALISFVAAFTVMFAYSPLYSCVIIASYLPIVIFDQIYIRKMYQWQMKNVGEERKLNYIADLVTQKIHAKNIRFFSIADYLLNLYKGIWEAWFQNRKKILKKWSAITLILSVVPQALTVLVLIQTGVNILNGANSIGDFTLYSGMIGQMVSGVFLFTFSIVRIGENEMRVRDFQEFEKWENQVEGSGEEELKSIDTIHFDRVSFTYPHSKEPTLDHIDFKIRAKERLALVGVNGAGKTTIIKLLLRFYDVSEGRILINGKDIKSFTPQSIRRQFSVMFQDDTNYAFTLRQNICISDVQKPCADRDILDACQKSGVDDIMQNWEAGLDTYLYREFEETGQDLSGGENQKIVLARTFFRDSAFVILDEPSASLDPEAESILFQNMAELSKDKGLILISHRLSNVIMADTILVIEQGRLIEQGSHDQLIKADGRYAALFRQQAEKYTNPHSGEGGRHA